MTLVYYGSLASVHSRKPASPSRVSSSCSSPLHILFFWLKSASTDVRACCQLLIVLAGAITSLSIGVVGNCLICPLIGFALQPARVPSCLVPVIQTRENTPRPEPGVCGCGPCVCEEPRASQSQWSETAGEGAAFLFNLVVGFVIGVCTCVSLCCAQPMVSRDIIVAAEQFRSLPES